MEEFLMIMGVIALSVLAASQLYDNSSNIFKRRDRNTHTEIQAKT